MPVLSGITVWWSAELSQEGEASPEHIVLHECPECGRKFNRQALEKHSRVCKKVAFAKEPAAFSAGWTELYVHVVPI
eukprot:scaffold930_cov408-Prasinococcus_capsulatus_cf.AAC.3